MNMNLQPLLSRAVHQPLSEADARAAALVLMSGEASPAQAGGLLSALRARGEAYSEIVGFARALRENARPFPRPGEDCLDTCGTGGDGLATFNVSTLAALVVAACGVRVVKHGNRAVSSRCGSADLLEALEIRTEIDPVTAARCLDETNFAFLFAPSYHPMLKSLGPVRRELGIRSIFNLAGPLANPARVGFQLVGVPARDLLEPVAEALRALGVRRALVVHGEDGADEISLTGATHVVDVSAAGLVAGVIRPQEAGLSEASPGDLSGGDAIDNARAAERLLDGAGGPLQDFVVLNAAAALRVAGQVATLPEGVARARRALSTGEAKSLVFRLRELTRGVA